MNDIRCLLTLSLLLCSPLSLAVPYSFRPTSFEDHGVCPLDCCRYTEWTVNQNTSIRKTRSHKAAVVFTAKKSDQVKALTGVVLISKPGQARLLKSLVLNGESVDKGEVIHLLTPLGKDSYKIWYRGKRVRDFDRMQDLEIITPPQSIWWVKIQNNQGQTGWSNQPEHFDNKAVCQQN